MLDPYGLGPLDWLITGYWDPPEGVYDAALDEFARSNSDRTHGTADAIVSEVTGGLIDSVGGTAFDSGNRDAAASTAGGIITAADFAITGGGKAIAGGIAKVGGGLIKGTAKAAAGAIDAGDAAKAAKKATKAAKKTKKTTRPRKKNQNKDRTNAKRPRPGSKDHHPPGWNENWEWREGSRKHSGEHWWDENGGEWRWHEQDEFHSDSHWDYNPWDQWNSEWQNVPAEPVL